MNSENSAYPDLAFSMNLIADIRRGRSISHRYPSKDSLARIEELEDERFLSASARILMRCNSNPEIIPLAIRNFPNYIIIQNVLYENEFDEPLIRNGVSYSCRFYPAQCWYSSQSFNASFESKGAATPGRFLEKSK
jgi:hypothetical protein